MCSGSGSIYASHVAMLLRALAILGTKAFLPELTKPLRVFTLTLTPLHPARARFCAPALTAEVIALAARVLAPLPTRCAIFHTRAARIALGYASALARCRFARSQEKRRSVWLAQHRRCARLARRAADDLQGFYAKAAQALAAKGDLLPQAYTSQLSGLLDDCKPESIRTVRRVLSRELNMPLEQAFAELDTKPLACATIAQVHRAVDKCTGYEVAVKVQHRRSETLMANDMGTLIGFFTFLERIGVSSNIDLLSVLREYRRQVPSEFLFSEETTAMNAAHCCLAPDFPVRVPKPVNRLCSERVLTMTMLQGVSMSSLIERKASWPIKAPASWSDCEKVEHVVLMLCEGYGRMIFSKHLIHGDCHGGNILVHGECNPCLLDFGLHRWLTREQLVPLARLTVALANESPHATLVGLQECGLALNNTSYMLTCTAAHLIFDTRMDMEEAHFAPWSEDAQEFRDARLDTLPEDLFLVARSIALMRGLLSACDGADVHCAKVWAPHAYKYLDDEGVEDIDTEEGRKRTPSEPSKTSNDVVPPADLYSRMRQLKVWLRDRHFPNSRAELAPLAMNGVTSLQEALNADQRTFNQAFRHFSQKERERLKEEARASVAAGLESGSNSDPQAETHSKPHDQSNGIMNGRSQHSTTKEDNEELAFSPTHTTHAKTLSSKTLEWLASRSALRVRRIHSHS